MTATRRGFVWLLAATVMVACSTPRAADHPVTVRDDLPGRPIDRRVLGTNLPAWVGPTTLANPSFQAAAVHSGTTLVRMPGGSWSNAYDWLGCEVADASSCPWTWAARPSDYIGFLQATGLAGMWTLSANATAESGAAAVAFFDGSVDDTRPIGTDRNGVDWGTVGKWASLRAEHGHPQPAGIHLWEVGNEVYGGKPASGGGECASFGWEDVWTCDGTAYVQGDGRHDGYLAVRDAMHAVDPTIEVGAVGVADPGSWSGWGRDVTAAGDRLDFYAIHEYGFERSPDLVAALRRPASLWSNVLADVRSTLPPEVPIAVTEYNLVSVESGDTEHRMTQAVNALYVADTIGQLVDGGVGIANQWNLVNGTTASGTDYGLVAADTFAPFPAYDAVAMWGSTGDMLLPVEGADGLANVHVYPTRRADGSLAIVLLNLGGNPVSFDLRVAGLDGQPTGTLRAWHAERLDATSLVEGTPRQVSIDDTAVVHLDLQAWSMSLLEVAAHG